MTQAVLSAKAWVSLAIQDKLITGRLWRFAILALLLAVATASPELREVVAGAMSDAYLAVTVFVAGTLIVVYSLENYFKADLGRFLQRQERLQAPMAAFLGALPGCGGAIIVITQYIRGYITFGSVVSVLTATMGDAAFLLIAREPLTGLGIMAMGMVVGSISGWIVDWIHGPDFMRAKDVTKAKPKDIGEALETFGPDMDDRERAAFATIRENANRFWFLLLVPGVILGILLAFQVDTDAALGSLAEYELTKWFGVAAAVICLLMWAMSRRGNSQIAAWCPVRKKQYSTSERIVLDTNFVTVWVIIGFLVYELAVHFTGSGIETWLQVWLPIVPLMGVIVGLLPGCGPQIVTTTLYISGVIPLSAQIGNAISNDGDALFPAIALAPRAAIVATLYTTIPALILAYAWFFFME